MRVRARLSRLEMRIRFGGCVCFVGTSDYECMWCRFELDATANIRAPSSSTRASVSRSSEV